MRNQDIFFLFLSLLFSLFCFLFSFLHFRKSVDILKQIFTCWNIFATDNDGWYRDVTYTKLGGVSELSEIAGNQTTIFKS